MSRVKQLMALLVILWIVVYVYNNYTILGDWVVFTFFIIIAISFAGIFIFDKVTFGTSSIFYIFTLFFLGVAPLFQYLEGIVFWTRIPFTYNDYLKTNILLILTLILYRLIYNATLNKKIRLKSINNLSPITMSSYVLLAISIISSVYIFIAYGGRLSAILIRAEYSDADVISEGGITFLFHQFFIRPIPIICLLLFKYYNKKNRIIECILLLLTLLTNSPTGMPRFAVAGLYMPLIFVYFRKTMIKRFNFPLLMFFAITIVFPFLNIFRNRDMTSSFLSLFIEGDFDSYQLMMRVISEDYVTNGRQLLGVLFFFVPRSIWPTKPIGSGYFIANEENYYFDNISMNWFGEGYINFGIIGMLLFGALLGYVNARCDRKYWNELGNDNPLYSIIFFEFVGMEFIIMRGALLNVGPTFISYMIVTLLVYKCASLKISTIYDNR